MSVSLYTLLAGLLAAMLTYLAIRVGYRRGYREAQRDALRRIDTPAEAARTANAIATDLNLRTTHGRAADLVAQLPDDIVVRWHFPQLDAMENDQERRARAQNVPIEDTRRALAGQRHAYVQRARLSLIDTLAKYWTTLLLLLALLAPAVQAQQPHPTTAQRIVEQRRAVITDTLRRHIRYEPTRSAYATPAIRGIDTLWYGHDSIGRHKELLAPGVVGVILDEPHLLHLFWLEALHPGRGEVSHYLDQLPRDKTIHAHTVLNPKMKGMLARRGFVYVPHVDLWERTPIHAMLYEKR